LVGVNGFLEREMADFGYFFRRNHGTPSNEGCGGIYKAFKGCFGLLGVTLGVHLGHRRSSLAESAKIAS
jgi:hypothetical protein